MVIGSSLCRPGWPLTSDDLHILLPMSFHFPGTFFSIVIVMAVMTQFYAFDKVHRTGHHKELMPLYVSKREVIAGLKWGLVAEQWTSK